MAKQYLGEKTVRELRTMAKRSGIAVKEYWHKDDLVKALSLEKKSEAKPVKPVKKTKQVKTARKNPSGKTLDKKSIPRNAAGSRLIKKSLKKTQTAKQKSVSLKAPPKKSPLTDFVPETVKPSPEMLTPLPAEYGGDKIVSMQVTPKRIYVYWEVPEDRLVKYKGSLNLKVLDMKEKNFFYMPVSGRVGEAFIDISPDSDFAVEIGIIDSKGEFVNIIQTESSAVTNLHSELQVEGSPGEIPACEQLEMIGQSQKRELALPEEFFEMPGPISSH
ncbi:MAG TPA: DUF4912 domain-containing protein [Dissulfurispiraceae bacterium]|nr:DUF4912 domain-containing protein [Dissulfurispiraceae bacterium]